MACTVGSIGSHGFTGPSPCSPLLRFTSLWDVRGAIPSTHQSIHPISSHNPVIFSAGALSLDLTHDWLVRGGVSPVVRCINSPAILVLLTGDAFSYGIDFLPARRNLVNHPVAGVEDPPPAGCLSVSFSRPACLAPFAARPMATTCA